MTTRTAAIWGFSLITMAFATACDSAGGGGGGGFGPVCGNGFCETGEGPAVCPADCGGGEGGPVCGNGSCESGETASSCAADCGPKVTCGDGVCTPGAESFANCANDCPCTSHSQCSSTQICLDGDCTSAVGRVYTVSVQNATIDFTQNSVDGDSSNPDPFVRIYFPTINKLLATTSTKHDTLKPVWNESASVTVTAAGQEIWFCAYDSDAFADDELFFSGTANCKGYDNIVDFIRAGTATLIGTADVLTLNVRIDPK